MRFPIFTFQMKFDSSRHPGTIQFERWRVLVAGLVTITTISLLVAAIIVSSTFEKSEISQDVNTTEEISISHFGVTPSDTNVSPINSRVLPMSQVYCLIQNCVVTCSLIPTTSDPGLVASVFIDSEYESHCPDKMIVEELILENCGFSSTTLSSGWFPSKFHLKKLTLKGCSLTLIDSDAFSTVQFYNLTSLAIIDGGISLLEKSLFDSLTNLEELVISNNAIAQVDDDLLAGTANALQVIQINNAIYSSDVLMNIIGRSQLPNVLLLSLTGNHIDTISSDVFKGVPNVQSLYLTNSGISSVEYGAFEPLSGSIRQLFLSENRLSSLPINAFDSILKMNPNFRLALANNEWNCECELEWLKNLTSTQLLIVADEPRCVTPERNAMIKLSEADFCSGGSETTKLPVNVTVTTDNLVTLTCTVDEETPTTSGRRLLSTLELKFHVKFPDYSIQEVEAGSVYVNLRNTTSAYTLIWFDNDIEDSVNCMTNVRNSLYLDQLQPGVSYTICLLDIARHLTSPFNCLSLRMTPAYTERLWLANKDKTMTISILIVVLIIACLMSVTGSYYVVRENPKLLKGSKRIIMVRHRAAEAIVLPEGITVDYGNLPKVAASISRSSSQKDYVSPINQRRLLSRKGSSVSGTSSRTGSSGNSYVSGIEPTSVQLMAWRIRRIKEIMSCNKTTDVEESLPPLPPPRHKIPSVSLNLEERSPNEQIPLSVLTMSNDQSDLEGNDVIVK